ncbi:hypothetical protein MHAE_12041 [Mycobacterium haemophilum DSM 44634]|uniref:hypothetical protein n=1 Tax=Mycobacterium haemophilum TaxID=29311 RepID=UPI0006554D96|nr:hypothetical protein [Mycobacterium haemophilum]AKN18311.1 hypothetical protein B586_19755 [Mycobacterium haemophilum DSM 44634]MCV7342756.1 hypothetical protein [Mycobacterium haemophilum DSM 44634]
MSQAPGNEIPDTLASLDWHQFTCQSEVGCTHPATHIVHRHAVDECSNPNLDPGGNIVDILCIGCVRSLRLDVLRQVSKLTRHPGAYCLTCGAPLHELSDIIRNTVRLTS